MQTGQPGPMITLSEGGKAVRSPNLAIACSWLPHTCITETWRGPTAAVTRASAAASAAARAGSRNFSSLAAGLAVTADPPLRPR